MKAVKNNFDIIKFQKEAKMKKLIIAAMDRFEPEQLLELMYERCCNATQREYLKDKMVDLTTFEGGIFIKVDTLQQKEKLRDFIGQEIYPYYNEQQTQIFAY